MKIGKLIKVYRKKCGITQLQLAEETNYSVNTVKGLENDYAGASLKIVSKLSRGFNGYKDDFIAEYVDMVNKSGTQNEKEEIELLSVRTGLTPAAYERYKENRNSPMMKKMREDMKKPLVDQKKKYIIDNLDSVSETLQNDIYNLIKHELEKSN